MNLSNGTYPLARFVGCSGYHHQGHSTAGGIASVSPASIHMLSFRSGERRQVERVSRETNQGSSRQTRGWEETNRQRSFCTSLRGGLRHHPFPSTVVTAILYILLYFFKSLIVTHAVDFWLANRSWHMVWKIWLLQNQNLAMDVG